MAEDHPRSGTSAGPGLMIGVEFVTDRATREPDGARRGVAAGRRRRPDAADVRREHQVIRWIPPIDVDRAGGRGGPGHLRGRAPRLSRRPWRGREGQRTRLKLTYT